MLKLLKQKRSPKSAKKTKKKRPVSNERKQFISCCVITLVALLIVALSLSLKVHFKLSGIDTVTMGYASLSTAEVIIISVFAAALAIISLSVYLLQNESQTVRFRKKLFIIMSLISIGSLMSMATMLISDYFGTMLLTVILCCILVNKRIAYAVALSVSFINGVMAFFPVYDAATGNYLVETWIPLAIMLVQFAGSFCAIYPLSRKHGRMSPIISGLIGGVASAIVFMGVQAIINRSLSNLVEPMLYLVGSGLICGIVATGLMPVLEIVFDVSTDSRLNELMNNNNPLIKRLMLEAPGTYHHSMLVASLAEAAAEQVGANPLLCKAAGYYHDVGKLRSPMHFIENQRGSNIHDTLPPEESASRIIAHKKDGVNLLIKHKLPGDVIKICSEHHGDSTVAYFYNKAIQQSNGQSVNEVNYKYKGNKPSSKESGIVMLADCCEAAVRSLKVQNSDSITSKVHEVISSLWLKPNGQLSECPLTALDIKLIEKCFINTLTAQYHERVEYPDTKGV